MFSNADSKEDTFIKTGFRNWRKFGDRVQKHTDSEAHKESVNKQMCFKQAQSKGKVADQLDSYRHKILQENRTLLKTIAQVLCASQEYHSEATMKDFSHTTMEISNKF